MSCERPPAQLYRFLDGELASPEAEEMAQHLQTCPACQEEVVAHRRLQGLLRTAVQEDEVPEQLWSAIHQRLVQEPQVRHTACRTTTAPLVAAPRDPRGAPAGRLGGASVAHPDGPGHGPRGRRQSNSRASHGGIVYSGASDPRGHSTLVRR